VGQRVHAIHAIEQMNVWFDDEANGQARGACELEKSDDGKIAKAWSGFTAPGLTLEA
jgi:hypothetical protein